MRIEITKNLIVTQDFIEKLKPGDFITFVEGDNFGNCEYIDEDEEEYPLDKRYIKERLYKVCDVEEDEVELACKELNTDAENLLCIYDVENIEGECWGEVYDEIRQLGFPPREKDVKTIKIDDYEICYWEIFVPEVGKGILIQDASPMSIIFKKDELIKSGLKFIR